MTAPDAVTNGAATEPLPDSIGESGPTTGGTLSRHVPMPSYVPQERTPLYPFGSVQGAARGAPVGYIDAAGRRIREGRHP